MLLFDVNIYVYAHREDVPYHTEIRTFLENSLSGDTPAGYSPLALSGFLRVVTHPKIFSPPSDLDTAIEFCRSITEFPGSVPVIPGDSQWSIFTHLLRASGVKGNLVPDAWFAALAIEHGCTWVTRDRDYTRFSGLKVEFPLMP